MHGRPIKTRQFSTLASEIDLLAEGECAAAAQYLWVTTAGNVWVVEDGDGFGQQIALLAGWNYHLWGSFREVGLGVAAVKTCTGGTYPAVLAAPESIVIRLDEGTIKDPGADVTVAFAAGSFTLAQIVAAINAAFVAAGVAQSIASDASGQLRLTGRAHGTAGAVEIVSIGATLAAATGLTVATTNGTASGAAAGLIVQW